MNKYLQLIVLCAFQQALFPVQLNAFTNHYPTDTLVMLLGEGRFMRISDNHPMFESEEIIVNGTKYFQVGDTLYPEAWSNEQKNARYHLNGTEITQGTVSGTVISIAMGDFCYIVLKDANDRCHSFFLNSDYMPTLVDNYLPEGEDPGFGNYRRFRATLHWEKQRWSIPQTLNATDIVYYVHTIDFKPTSRSVERHALESLIIEWPADDMICDRYDHSNGELFLRAIRLKASKTIIDFEVYGAYCQGDSDFAESYSFTPSGSLCKANSLIYADGPWYSSFYQDSTLVITNKIYSDSIEQYHDEYGGSFPDFYNSSHAYDEIEWVKKEMRDRRNELDSLLNLDDVHTSEFILLSDVNFRKEGNTTRDKLDEILSDIRWNDETSITYRRAFPLSVAEKVELPHLIPEATILENADDNSTIIHQWNGLEFELYCDSIKKVDGTNWYSIEFKVYPDTNIIKGWVEESFIPYTLYDYNNLLFERYAPYHISDD